MADHRRSAVGASRHRLRLADQGGPRSRHLRSQRRTATTAPQRARAVRDFWETMSRTLSRREKGLATAVGLVVFLFGNFLFIDWAWSSVMRLRTDIATKTRQLRMIGTLT